MIQLFRLDVRAQIVACLCLSYSAVSWAAAGGQVLQGHVPKAVSAAAAVGKIPPSGRFKLAIGFPLRNRQGLTDLLTQLYIPASPQYHQYLPPEKFTERFGP